MALSILRRFGVYIGLGIGIRIGIGIGKVTLGIVYDVTHCYNLEKKCVPPY